MGTLGKVLVFVNLLAAGGLVYVATQDWAKRQEVTSTALRFELTKSGLPLDAKSGSSPAASSDSAVPLPVGLPGGVTVETVRPELLKEYFKGAEGGQRFGNASAPPATQIDEVKRVQGILQGMLTSAAPGQKLALLCGQSQADGTFVPGILARLAESYEEFDIARRLTDPATADIDGVTNSAEAAALAEKLLTRRFDAVLNPPNPQLAQEQADKLATLAKEVETAFGPVNSALDALKTATDTVTQAGKTAMANPLDPTAQQDLTAAKTRLQSTSEQVEDATKKLMAARQPLYDELVRPIPAAARDESDRRRRLAHLLMFLESDAAWQQRVARVVGLEQYLAALSAQTGRITDMTWAVEQLIRADQGQFTAEYEQYKQQALDRQAILDQQLAVTSGLADQAARDDENLKLRVRQRDDRIVVLADLRKDVAKQLAAQAEVEQKLFNVQKEVGQTLLENFELESDLEKAERQALQGQPRTTPGTGGN